MKSIDIQQLTKEQIVLNITREGLFLTVVLTEQEAKDLLSALQAIIEMKQTKVQDIIDRSGPYSNPID